jgi:Ca2+:H+ antiporter
MSARSLWRAAWLLVPAALAIRLFAPGHGLIAFVLACLSLAPLARTLGDATHQLAARLGPAAGSILNASFGNAAELIIGVAGLAHGHVALVKGSLVGSILGNLLLVAGAAIVAGGVRFPRLLFSRVLAGASVSTLFLAVVAFATPAMLGSSRPLDAGEAGQLSRGIAVVLLAMYALSLLFQLRTQPKLHPPAPEDLAAGGAPPQSIARALLRLVSAAAATAVASEVLVASLDAALAGLRLPEIFVGVVVVAVVGNAAEHSTAVVFGRRGDMDVALGIAWESSKQIALFVAPALVFAGFLLGAPMDLVFSPFEVVAVALAVISTALIALDGETHWLEGAFLLAVYAVLGLGFFCLR